MEIIKVSDFLSYDLFTRRYSIPKEIDPGWPILTLLGEKEGNVIEGKTKLVKELFIIMTNFSIRMPFEFKKFPRGPYDRKITESINRLDEEGWIDRNKKCMYKNNYWVKLSLTEEGKKIYEEEIKPKLSKFPHLLKSFQATESPHQTGSSLSDYCYQYFRLKKKHTSKELWIAMRKDWLEEIKEWIDKLMSTRFKKHVSRDLEYQLLMPVQYCKDVIVQEDFDPLNEKSQVESSIVLKTIGNILDKVESIIMIVNSKEPDKSDFNRVKNKLEEFDRHFYFLNEYCRESEIFPSLYNEKTEPSDFLTKGEYKRVETMVNT